MFNSDDLPDRQIRAAVREYDELSDRRYTIIKLDRPIQRGWQRLYTVADHALTRRDRPILEAILRVIGSVVVHSRPDFRRRQGRRKKLVEIDQPLRSISTDEWRHRAYPEAWLRYFRYELILQRNRHWQPYWVFAQPTLFILKVERHWLWYFREIDPAIETRLSELERWLESRQGWYRHGWLKGRRQSYWWKLQNAEKQRSLQREHQREIARAYDTFPEVEPAASARRGRFSLHRGIVTRFEPDVRYQSQGLPRQESDRWTFQSRWLVERQRMIRPTRTNYTGALRRECRRISTRIRRRGHSACYLPRLYGPRACRKLNRPISI